MGNLQPGGPTSLNLPCHVNSSKVFNLVLTPYDTIVSGRLEIALHYYQGPKIGDGTIGFNSLPCIYPKIESKISRSRLLSCLFLCLQEKTLWKKIRFYNCSVVKMLPTCHPPSPHKKDKLIWLHTLSGQFTVKSAYWLMSDLPNTSLSSIWSTWWHVRLPPRLRFLGRRITLNIMSLPEKSFVLMASLILIYTPIVSFRLFGPSPELYQYCWTFWASKKDLK